MPEHTKPAGASGQSAMHVLVGIYSSIFITQILCLELKEEVACDTQEIILKCDDDSFLAIHEARFTTNASEGLENCVLEYDSYEESLRLPATNDTCTEDIRMSVNYRCSGNRSCTFSLDDHHPTRVCADPGTLIVLYDCVPDSKVHKICNWPVNGTEGYVKSPGYPNYYPGPLECEWPLKADVGQRMRVSILDLSLVDSHSDELHCPDRFRLMDGKAKLLDTCGETRNILRQFESEDSDVTAQLNTHAIGAKRGILLWFKAFGCRTLEAPRHGYLVFRNSSFAQYMCCTNHYFEDDLKRTRNLYCIDGSEWNTGLAPCLDKKTLTLLKNMSAFDIDDDDDNYHHGDDQSIHKVPLSDADVIFDIMVPSVIMGVLVLGNAIIVAVLLKLRRSVKEEPEGIDNYTSPSHQTEIQPEAPLTRIKPPPKPQPPPKPVNSNPNSNSSHIYMKPSTSSEQMRPKQKLVTEV